MQLSRKQSVQNFLRVFCEYSRGIPGDVSIEISRRFGKIIAWGIYEGIPGRYS